jgi:hypothetical protein
MIYFQVQIKFMQLQAQKSNAATQGALVVVAVTTTIMIFVLRI